MKQLNLFGEEVIENVKDNEISHKAKSYTGLYALHKYWGKKPYNIMADFIDKYTSPNEIVLDPFLGSGVSITEAVFKGRKGFGIDINPSAIFITSQILAKVNPKNIIAEFKSLENDLKEKINSFYTVNRNGENYLGQNYLWENQELTEVRFTNGTRNRQSETPTNEDIALAESVDIKNIKSYYPTSNFFHNSRINAKGTENVSKLFTPRNLNALSLLFERIEKIENSEIRDLFKFCFTSSIGQASKMVFVIKRRNKTKNNGNIIVSEKKEIGSWVIGYWQPKEFFENNVWTCFETRFKKILKAKKDQYSLSNLHISSESFEELEKVGNYLLVNQPCQKYLKLIDDNSIDYILTDPPHGNRIPYLELSLLWNSWLKKDVNYEDEIIVSESKERKKNSTNYNELMNEAIKECLRVLKPERHFSFMFNSLDDDAWLNVVKTFHEIGFELEVIETLGYSANSVVQDNRKNGLQTDFIITYKKPKEIDLKRRLEIIDLIDYPDLVLQIINLKKKGYKPFQIMNNIFCEVLKKNQFFMISELFKTIENA
jgi:DNA modification methylase